MNTGRLTFTLLLPLARSYGFKDEREVVLPSSQPQSS